MLQLGAMACGILLLAAASCTRQHADTSFIPDVRAPAHVDGHPLVLIDEAHFNFHTMGGTYRPFARLVTSDGCRVEALREPIDRGSLAAARMLVIANAMGGPDRPGMDSIRATSAFHEHEMQAVEAWVRDGGSLLLVADHRPAGAAARDLAARFGIRMSGGVAASHAQAFGRNPTWLLFSDENGLVGDHPIITGRDTSERVHRVVAFTGQSLRPVGDATVLLRFAPDVLDGQVGESMSAGGWCEAVALTFGRGRVVVMGEAGMLTAQVASGGRRFGMNVPGIDGRRFALNVERWLTGAL